MWLRCGRIPVVVQSRPTTRINARDFSDWPNLVLGIGKISQTTKFAALPRGYAIFVQTLLCLIVVGDQMPIQPNPSGNLSTPKGKFLLLALLDIRGANLPNYLLRRVILFLNYYMKLRTFYLSVYLISYLQRARKLSSKLLLQNDYVHY